MGIDRIGAYADDGGLPGGVLILIALEVVGFDRAALGRVLRVEVEDDPPAAEILEADVLAFLGFECEVRCVGSFCRGSAGEAATNRVRARANAGRTFLMFIETLNDYRLKAGRIQND